MAKSFPPLNGNSSIVDSKGNPKPEFILLINALLGRTTGDALSVAQAAKATADAAAANVAALATHDIVPGTGLDGGGPLSDVHINLALADTAVAPGTYGDATHVGQFTVDQQGRLTAAGNVPIAGGGGGGFTVLFDTVLTAAAATVNIPSISQAFTDLRLIVRAGRNGGGADYFGVQCNGDTGANYQSYTENRFGTATHNNLLRFGAADSPGSDHGVSDGYIFDYTNPARYKASLSQGAFIQQQFIDRNAALWNNVAAITDLDLVMGSGQFCVDTHITLLAY